MLGNLASIVLSVPAIAFIFTHRHVRSRSNQIGLKSD